MTRRAVALALLLAGCAPAAGDAPAPAAPTWADNVQAFCQARDQGWLSGLLDRIDRALPADFQRGSIAFAQAHLQDRLDGAEGAKELQLRFSAQRAGAAVALSAYGAIDRDSCAVRDLQAIEGVNRFDPPVSFAVPD